MGREPPGFVKQALDLIQAFPGLGMRWPTARRPTLRRILMPGTQNHIYYRVDAKEQVIHVLAVWGVPKKHGPKV